MKRCTLQSEDALYKNDSIHHASVKRRPKGMSCKISLETTLCGPLWDQVSDRLPPKSGAPLDKKGIRF